MHFLASTQPPLFKTNTMTSTLALSCEVAMCSLISNFLFLSLFISITKYHDGWPLIQPLSTAVWSTRKDFPTCQTTSNSFLVTEHSPTLTLF